MTTSDEVVRRLDIKDDQMFKLGDVIDVKASIALVVITFLATQTGDFLKDPHTSIALHYIQLVSAISLAVGGVLALVELWPRDYEHEPAEALDGWEGELRAYYKNEPNAEDLIQTALRAGLIKRLRERVEFNTALNERKSRMLFGSFCFVAIALTCNLATLILRAAR